jgi:hypothetical protein
MIVDLLRNDLSRVCRPLSVQVQVSCGLESYASVHHLVSVVTGELTDDQDAVSLLRVCFPGARSPARRRSGPRRSSSKSKVGRERSIAERSGSVEIWILISQFEPRRSATARPSFTPAAALPRCRNQRPNKRRRLPRPNASSMHSIASYPTDHARNHLKL